MTEYRLVPNNWKIFSGSALKLIAIISMFIDHTACHLIDQKLVLLRLWGHELTLYRLMRDLGRLAFPIFCFLLIEGFLHTRFRLYQFYHIFMEHIARYAVALRVSDDDGVKLLWKPLFTESAVTEISVKGRNRQHNFISIKRLVGDIVFHQQCGGRLGRRSDMCFDVFADTVRKRKIFILKFSQLQRIGENIVKTQYPRAYGGS